MEKNDANIKFRFRTHSVQNVIHWITIWTVIVLKRNIGKCRTFQVQRLRITTLNDYSMDAREYVIHLGDNGFVKVIHHNTPK